MARVKIVVQPVALALLALVAQHRAASAQADTVFVGHPAGILTERAVSREFEAIRDVDAAKLDCVITMSGGRYYWASRLNTELRRVEEKKGSPYATFVAVDGSGYIAVVKSQYRATLALIDESAMMYDYAEHVIQWLSSVTYFGKFKKGSGDLGPSR